MAEKLISMAEELAQKGLPVLDASIERFRMLLDRPATTNQHLAEIIRSDIGYTLAVFRAVNSNSPEGREPVQTIEHAISLLGIGKVGEIGQSLIPVSRLAPLAQQEIVKIYSRGVHAGNYYEALAMQLELPDPVSNAKTARLMNLASVLLWTNNPELLAEHQQGRSGHNMLNSIEPMDIELRELSHAIAEKWGLPQVLQQALSEEVAWSKQPLALSLINSLAIETSYNWYSSGTDYLLGLWSDLSGIDKDQVSATVHQLAALTARQITEKEIPSPAFSLIQPPPEPEAEQEKEKPVKAESPVETKVAEKKSAKQAAGKTKAKQPPVTLQQAITSQMKYMQEQAGVERVLFAMLTPDRKHIKVRFVLGGSRDDDIRKFTINLEKRSLFSLLMQKPHGIWLTKDNQGKYLPLIPAKLREGFQTENLFAMSMFVQKKPVGLFIGDSTDKLDANQYTIFKRCSLKAAKALEIKS